MSQTILITSNDDLKRIYTSNLKTLLGTEVINRSNADEAIDLLKILPQVNLVISQVKVGHEDSARKIHDFLKAEGLNTSLIILGDNKTISSDVLRLQEPVNCNDLIKLAAKELGVTFDLNVVKNDADFYPVSISHFYEITRTPCDVYIKIKKSARESQYVKRIFSKDHFDKKDIKKYEDQGLKEFYIIKESVPYFMTFVANTLVQKLERSDLGPEDRIITTANAYDIATQNIQRMGLDDANIELSDATIESMIKSIGESTQIAELVKFLFSQKVSYAYQQCHLLTLMCHYVLSKQSWYRPEHLNTLCFVSFFSDVTLRTNEQMKVSSKSDLDHSQLTVEEKELVLNHAKHAVDLLKTHPDASEYIKTVLLQSHGTLDGVGFADKPSEELHPLSKVFIVADVFVKTLLDPTKPSHKKEILPFMSNRFSNPSYTKIMRTMEQRF